MGNTTNPNSANAPVAKPLAILQVITPPNAPGLGTLAHEIPALGDKLCTMALAGNDAVNTTLLAAIAPLLRTCNV